MSEQKRLFRSSTDRMVGGISGGLARYFQIDPTFVRLAFVMLALFNGVGVLIYLVMWLAVPDEKSLDLTGEAVVRANLDEMREQVSKLAENVRGGSSAPLLGIILVVIGAIFLAERLIPSIPPGIIRPVVFIGVGAYLLFARR